MMLFRRTLLPLAAILSLTSCAIAPAYHKPAAPKVLSYLPVNEKLSVPNDKAPVTEPGKKIPPAWWQTFNSNELNRFIQLAVRHNPSIAATSEALAVAQENLQAAEGIFYPQVSGNLGAERSRDSGAGLGTGSPKVYSLYTGTVSVSYSPDIFGLNHLIASEGIAQVDIARDQLDAARLTLEGNVAQTYFDLAATVEKIQIIRKTISEELAILKLVKTRFKYGSVSDLDVASQEAVLANSRAQLPSLLQRKDVDEHLLAIYTGKFPSEIKFFTTPNLDLLNPPTRLPLRVPSMLVRARPDIRAGEASLRAANAKVGIAVASMYPDFTLSADYGGKGANIPSLFDPAGRIWSLAANLAAPIFEGGTLLAEKRAAQAAYRGVFDQYRSISLEAFRQVADVLQALEHDAETLAADRAALEAAKNVYLLARVQYEQGSIDQLALLNSESQYQTAKLTFVSAKLNRLDDSVAYFVAMGGGDGAQ